MLTKTHGLTGKPSNNRLPTEKREQIIEALKEGYTRKSIAEHFGVNLGTVTNIKKSIQA